MREHYIDIINYYQDILRIIRDKHEQWNAISEYDSIYQDILDYQDNKFEDFKTEKDFKNFIDYLRRTIIVGLEVEKWDN